LIGFASAAAVPIAAVVPAVAEASADPIFAAIKAHRKAYAGMQAIFAEHRKAHEIAAAKVSPAHIHIQGKVDPGDTIEGISWIDIERAIPREQYPGLFARHYSLLEERRAAHAAIVESLIGGDEDELTDEPCSDELDTRDAFSETVPTTIPDLLAMIVYAGEVSERDAEAFADSNCWLIETLATPPRRLHGCGHEGNPENN
jgi:hypothetical protein